MSGSVTPASILVVRLGAMGDVIHALPAAAAIRRSFPEAKLAWAIEPKWAVLLRGSGLVDRIIEVDRRSWMGIRRARTRLRSERVDLAIDFQGLIKSAIVAAVSAPAVLAGFDAPRERAASVFYSRRVSSVAQHVVDRNLDLARAVGASAGAIEFPLPPGLSEGSLPDSPFVLASPSAGWRSKQWPLEYYAELGERLVREAGIPLVLNGPISEDLKGVPHILPHFSSVAGLIDATRRAWAVVGVDSGPLHLAAALGKRGVAIFGPTDPSRNGPYGGNMRVLRSPHAETTYQRAGVIHPAMRAIKPDAVFEALVA